MTKTIDEINEKIRKGKAVVVTAKEIIGITKEKGVKKAALRSRRSHDRHIRPNVLICCLS